MLFLSSITPDQAPPIDLLGAGDKMPISGIVIAQTFLIGTTLGGQAVPVGVETFSRLYVSIDVLASDPGSTVQFQFLKNGIPATQTVTLTTAGGVETITAQDVTHSDVVALGDLIQYLVTVVPAGVGAFSAAEVRASCVAV